MEPLVDIIIEDRRWNGIDLPALAERAALAVFEDRGLDPMRFEISLMACDDARIAALNGTFRGKPKPTNVLSWPTADLAAAEEGGTPDAPEPFLPDERETGESGTGERESIGDIAIAWETCLGEAEDGQKPLADHVTHLIVHGVLHLLGYDHVREGDARLMEGIEIRVLDRMGIPDPYGM